MRSEARSQVRHHLKACDRYRLQRRAQRGLQPGCPTGASRCPQAGMQERAQAGVQIRPTQGCQESVPSGSRSLLHSPDPRLSPQNVSKKKVVKQEKQVTSTTHFHPCIKTVFGATDCVHSFLRVFNKSADIRTIRLKNQQEFACLQLLSR